MIQYTSRVGVFAKTITLHLTEQSLLLLDLNGNETRRIPLEQIEQIQQYEGIGSRDPNSGRYRSEICKLVVKHGSPIRFRNGTYLRPDGKISDVSQNQVAEYDAFLSEFKRQLVLAAPNIRVVSGSLLASLAWGLNGILGLGLLVLGVVAFFTDEFWTALGLALFGFGFGSLLVFLGITMGRAYWPTSTPLREGLLREG